MTCYCVESGVNYHYNTSSAESKKQVTEKQKKRPMFTSLESLVSFVCKSLT